VAVRTHSSSFSVEDSLPLTIHLYVEDIDASYKKAVAAGAQATMPVSDMFGATGSGSSRTPSGTSGRSPPTRKT